MFVKEFFENINFEKNQQKTTKALKKIPSMQRVDNGISCKRIVCIKLKELCCIKYHSDTLYHFYIKNKYQDSDINGSCCDNSIS